MQLLYTIFPNIFLSKMTFLLVIEGSFRRISLRKASAFLNPNAVNNMSKVAEKSKFINHLVHRQMQEAERNDRVPQLD